MPGVCSILRGKVMADAGEEQGRYRLAEDVPERYYDIEQRRMVLEAGWLGGMFGSKANAPTNIAGMGLILLMLPLFFMLFFPSNIPPLEYLERVLPIIGAVFGYLFGKST
jgi:hypothetical protein